MGTGQTFAACDTAARSGVAVVGIVVEAAPVFDRGGKVAE